jgi:Flp pilus assembly protein TadD
MNRIAWMRGLLPLATLLLFSPVLGFGFVNFDDGEYVTDVAAVSGGLSWEGVRWAFLERSGVAWQPLTWLSHMLDFTLFGAHPAGHHATSVLLHAANALLLFELLRRLTRQPELAVLAAALFAWHPLRVESVAWVAERKDVLSMFFALATLHAWVGWARYGRRVLYAASVVCLALGLLAKSSLVTLPFLLLLLDHWPLERLRSWRQLPARIREKLPHAALVAASCIITLQVQRAAIASAGELGLVERIANAGLACARYLAHTVWPAHLSVHYAHPYLLTSGGTPPPAWVPGVCGGALLGVTLMLARPGAARPLRVAWLWFLGALVPMIGLVQVGAQGLADRYTYLPAIGLALGLVGVGSALVARLSERARPLALAGCAVGLAALAIRTGALLPVWSDSISLFENAHALEPRNAVVNTNLGHAHYEAGHTEVAETHLREAIRVNPRSWIAHYDYANVVHDLGRTSLAERHYREALRLAPDEVRVAGNLAGILQLEGRTAEAAVLYREVLARNPDDAVARLNLASLLHGVSQHAEAIRLYQEALARQPDDAVIWMHLAVVQREAGRLDEAITSFREALARAPELADVHAGLGNALGARGEFALAASHLERALHLEPDHRYARVNLEHAVALLRERGESASAARP